MKGKAYANKKSEMGRPLGDFYSTPKSLVWVAKDIIESEFAGCGILEPCYGEGAISSILKKWGHEVDEHDLYKDGENYLKSGCNALYVITNPPFSLWNEFLLKAKSHAQKIMLIGRLNYLGTQNRFKKGFWDNLKCIYPFSRYVDYQTPYRDDGLFHVGCMATGWFLWDMSYFGKPKVEIIDVQKYAKLGNFDGSIKTNHETIPELF